MNKLSCKDYRLLISRKVDNDLEKEELIDLNNHIIKCNNCYLYEQRITSLKNVFSNNVGSDHFIHFFHTHNTPKKRKSASFLKYVTVVVASVFLFIVMFSTYLYINKSNNIANNGIYNNYSNNNVSDEYYPMSAFIFYENIGTNKEYINYEITKDSGYFQYMMPANY